MTHFAAHVQAVPGRRLDFVDWMGAADIDAGTIDELEIVFSELVANAVAASPTTSHEVRVRAQVDDGILMLEVSNRTVHPAQLSLSNPDLDDPLRRSGRGLLIARALVGSVDIEVEHPDHLIVRCCRRLSPPR